MRPIFGNRNHDEAMSVGIGAYYTLHRLGGSFLCIGADSPSFFAIRILGVERNLSSELIHCCLRSKGIGFVVFL